MSYAVCTVVNHYQNRFFAVLVCCLVCSAGAWAGVVPNTVVVKFSVQSELLNVWLANHRSGSIPEFRPLLGAHNTSGYISDNVLTAVSRRIQVLSVNNRLSIRREPNTQLPNTRNLLAICVVTYQASIPPAVAAAKLSSLPGIQFAEPLAAEEIVGIPNDPLSGEQYHLSLTRATSAWDLLAPGAEPILVGIVDTGLDTAHVDLSGQLWHNQGESGPDMFGRDKRYNRVDDDENGFVDDWFGWDFVGADGNSPDNTPLPGNNHGTHVAGLVGAVINNNIGVAGMAQYVKLLPVKVGRDSPTARSVERSGDAILYAASLGARIINCSFGSSTPSFASLEVITTATQLGALVVAAAGNSSSNQAFYPAAHPPALSVAATDETDRRVFFSNFHPTVDVSAPGVNILSTMPGNTYQIQDGTSMASPIVAGCAALVAYAHPELTASQLHSAIKANAVNIDSLNISYAGQLGTGRIDALSSVELRNPRLAELVDVRFVDADSNNVIVGGERVEILCSVHNLLKDLTNVRLTIAPAPSNFQPIIDVNASDVGAIPSDSTVKAANAFTLRIPNTVDLNADLALTVTIWENDTVVANQLINHTVNPSYRTLHENSIAVTITSSGNIGFNDYPGNTQGDGLRWNDSRSLLFESGLLVGTEPTFLPNVVRGADASIRDNSFRGYGIVDINYDSIPNGARATATFTDDADQYPLGIAVKKNAYESTDDSLYNTVIVTYDITNTTNHIINRAFCSLFFDWDIGDAGTSDGVAWDNARGFAVVQNTSDLTLPTVGVSLLSGYALNIAAIDNQGGGGIPSIYDGFLRSEKWYTMSRGKLRTNSSVTDVSLMIGAGPINLEPRETKQIAFAISVGQNLENVTRYMNSARLYAASIGLNAVPYQPAASADRIVYIANAPEFKPGDPVVVKFELSDVTTVELSVVDLMGRTVAVPIIEHDVPAGTYERTFAMPDGASGVYVVALRTLTAYDGVPVQIMR